MPDQPGQGLPGGQYSPPPQPSPVPPPYYPYPQIGPTGYAFPSREGHSRLGIASFILSLVSGAATVAVIAISVMWFSANGGMEAIEDMDEDSPEALGIGLVAIFVGLAYLVALALGIAGCIQTRRKRIFGVLGLAISAAMLLLTGILFVVPLVA